MTLYQIIGILLLPLGVAAMCVICYHKGREHGDGEGFLRGVKEEHSHTNETIATLQAQLQQLKDSRGRDRQTEYDRGFKAGKEAPRKDDPIIIRTVQADPVKVCAECRVDLYTVERSKVAVMSMVQEQLAKRLSENVWRYVRVDEYDDIYAQVKVYRASLWVVNTDR